MEGIGTIVAVGEGVELSLGQAVVYIKLGAFAEYVAVRAEAAFPVDDTG